MTPKWIGSTPTCFAIGSSNGDRIDGVVPVFERKQPTNGRKKRSRRMIQPGEFIAAIASESLPARR